MPLQLCRRTSAGVHGQLLKDTVFPQVKLQEAIEYEDLQRGNGQKAVALNLKKSDRLVSPLAGFWYPGVNVDAAVGDSGAAEVSTKAVEHRVTRI